MKLSLLLLSFLFTVKIFSQDLNVSITSAPRFYDIKTIKATPVKNQGSTGTCWCFSSTSLLESEALRANIDADLSEMFTVRNIYIEKAKNYLLRTGAAQFSEGALGHDVIRSVALYGAVPESVYTGLPPGQNGYDHGRMFPELKRYLDSMIRHQPVSAGWLQGYADILDQYMGKPPAEFVYNGKSYTPLSYAKEVLKFNEADYVAVTSFTHQPYYQPFILQVPDNFSNGAFYNLPLAEMIDVVKGAVDKGYSVGWDADVSNNGFKTREGLALYADNSPMAREGSGTDAREMPYDAGTRQRLYESLTTQDDHLMHITGTEKTKDGRTFFIVKNSWGRIGPFAGYMHVSEAYFGINTISLIVPKAALPKALLVKLKL